MTAEGFTLVNVDEPMKHVLRPKPPWETVELTHCGRQAGTVPITTVDGVEAHVRKYGRQRTAYTHCMTCLERVQAYSRIDVVRQRRVPISWENDPVAVVTRWLDRTFEEPERARKRRILHAISALVEEHQAEFDAMVAADGVADLAAHRRERGA
jgi:hypothetical protein